MIKKKFGDKNMIWMNFIFAFIIALILTFIFANLLGRKGPWENNFLFFIVIFLGASSGGLWLKPVGPVISGSYIMNFILAGLILAIIISSASPVNKKERSEKSEIKTKKEFENEKKKRRIEIDVLLSILIFLLALSVLLGYSMN